TLRPFLVSNSLLVATIGVCDVGGVPRRGVFARSNWSHSQYSSRRRFPVRAAADLGPRSRKVVTRQTRVGWQCRSDLATRPRMCSFLCLARSLQKLAEAQIGVGEYGPG